MGGDEQPSVRAPAGFLGILLALALGIPTALPAQPPETQDLLIRFGAEDFVETVGFQDGDRHVWIAGGSGVQRVDESGNVSPVPGLEEAVAYDAVQVGSEYWIGTLEGLWAWTPGQGAGSATKIVPDTLGDLHITALAELEPGVPTDQSIRGSLVGTTAGLLRVTVDPVSGDYHHEPVPGQNSEISFLSVAPEGVWLGTKGAAYYAEHVEKLDQAVRIDVGKEQSVFNIVQAHGRLFLLTLERQWFSVCYVYEPDSGNPAEPIFQSVTTLAEVGEEVWLGAKRGNYYLHRLTADDGLEPILIDGLDQPINKIESVAGHGVFLATAANSLFFRPDGEKTFRELPDDLRPLNFKDVDHMGGIWVWGDKGAYRLYRDSRIKYEITQTHSRWTRQSWLDFYGIRYEGNGKPTLPDPVVDITATFVGPDDFERTVKKECCPLDMRISSPCPDRCRARFLIKDQFGNTASGELEVEPPRLPWSTYLILATALLNTLYFGFLFATFIVPWRLQKKFTGIITGSAGRSLKQVPVRFLFFLYCLLIRIDKCRYLATRAYRHELGPTYRQPDFIPEPDEKKLDALVRKLEEGEPRLVVEATNPEPFLRSLTHRLLERKPSIFDLPVVFPNLVTTDEELVEGAQSKLLNLAKFKDPAVSELLIRHRSTAFLLLVNGEVSDDILGDDQKFFSPELRGSIILIAKRVLGTPKKLQNFKPVELEKEETIKPGQMSLPD